MSSAKQHPKEPPQVARKLAPHSTASTEVYGLNQQPDTRRPVLVINLRKNGRTSVPGSCLRKHFGVRRDSSLGCRCIFRFPNHSRIRPPPTPIQEINLGWSFGEAAAFKSIVDPTDVTARRDALEAVGIGIDQRTRQVV